MCYRPSRRRKARQAALVGANLLASPFSVVQYHLAVWITYSRTLNLSQWMQSHEAWAFNWCCPWLSRSTWLQCRSWDISLFTVVVDGVCSVSKSWIYWFSGNAYFCWKIVAWMCHNVSIFIYLFILKMCFENALARKHHMWWAYFINAVCRELWRITNLFDSFAVLPYNSCPFFMKWHNYPYDMMWSLDLLGQE